MFMNKTQFKKMVKKAFNGSGLKVGYIYGGLVVSGNGWVSWTESGSIPNWVKAAVVEYAGQMPDGGELLEAKKGEPVQYLIADSPYYNLPERFKGAKLPYRDTEVVLQLPYRELRFFQENKGKIAAMPLALFSMIDFSQLEGESRPMGPSLMDDRMLVWKNECSAFAAATLTTDDERALRIEKALEGVDFWKEGE